MPDWYKTKVFIPLFLLLISISIVLAVPPVTEVFLGDTGFQIEYPYFPYIQQGRDFDFNAHVFNLTSGNPIVTGATCYFHLYNNTGKHLLELEDNVTSHNFDYIFNVGGRNFTRIGSYAYIISCNTSTEGGFVEVPFEVTETGTEAATPDTEAELLLYFALAISVLILILAFYKDDHNLAAISGMIQIVLGGYIIAVGFSPLTNTLSNALGIILIAIGFYIFLRSSIENF